MGGAPRMFAPRNTFWGGLSNHQAATAQMHLVVEISQRADPSQEHLTFL